MLNLDLSLYKGSTLLKDWWKQVKENFAQTQSQVNSLHVTLTNEITSRTNGDLSLSDRIESEETARTVADSALSTRLDDEISTRESADSTLSTSISDEKVARQNSFGALSSQLSDEKTARESQYSQLSSDIAAETADRIEACNDINDYILELFDTSHTHENMSVLNGISSSKVSSWDGAVTKATTNANEISKLNSLLAAVSTDLQELYHALGNNVFDGGSFKGSQGDEPLDGGSFTEEPLAPANFGTFKHPAIVALTGAA